MQSQPLVRRATHTDAADIAQIIITVQKLHADAHPDYFKQPELVEPFLDEVHRLLNEPTHCYLVAEEDGKIAGYLMAEIVRRSETLYQYARALLDIHQVAVLPESQHNGHGARLIEAAKELAKQEGLARLALNTWEFNTQAHKFFRKQGFVRFNQRLWMPL